MSSVIPDEYLVEHYPSLRERLADQWIHLVAIGAAALGTVGVVGLAMAEHRPNLTVVVALYGAALIAMLAFSAIYNLSRISPVRPALRRLDEAGIFLMIAGSYTPFTTQVLHGGWAIGMTTLVWVIAALGMVGKLTLPNLPEKAWTAVYMLFGWIAVLVLRPLSQSLPVAAIAMLIAGGLVYSGGCWVFLNRRLPFRRAVWHGFVVVGATLHFGAITAGVVLAHGHA